MSSLCNCLFITILYKIFASFIKSSHYIYKSLINNISDYIINTLVQCIAHSILPFCGLFDGQASQALSGGACRA